MSLNDRFNVRVYGLCVNDKDELLVTDERIHGMEITKLPGGGLEFGEGSLECLKREFLEECGQDVEVLSHFYTTDFFVPSAFNAQSQIISIYYKVRLSVAARFEIKTRRFDFPSGIEDVFVFRWVPLSELSPEHFTFPIDRRVAEMLLQMRKPV
jgi:8-oxo-dGTP diphosphatase